MDTLEILQLFLDKLDIALKADGYIKKSSEEYLNLYGDIQVAEYSHTDITRITAELLDAQSGNLKLISDALVKQGYEIGRKEKDILLKNLYYQHPEDKANFIELMKKRNPEIDEEKISKLIDKNSKLNLKKVEKDYTKKLTKALDADKNSRVADHLFTLFTRIHSYYNKENITLMDLYQYNLPYYEGNISKESLRKLQNYCAENLSTKNVVYTFYKKYIELLNFDILEKAKKKELDSHLNYEFIDEEILTKRVVRDRKTDIKLYPTESFDFIHLEIDQAMFDLCENKQDFLNYVLIYIQQCYRVLKNNMAFSVKINNIYDGETNLKWQLYSYIGIFAEKFIEQEENSRFYAPEILAFDLMSYSDMKLKDEKKQDKLLKSLKNYYANKTDKQGLTEMLKLLDTQITELELADYLENFRYVNYGFTFNDCIVNKNYSGAKNKQLENIEISENIIFIFYKYRMDQRKIPCPICGGLNIRGNSYPEVGHRSWECVNRICPERSKSNRGKRFSYKSNYMQHGYLDLKEENLMSKEFVTSWRRDVVSKSCEEIYEMLINYFSFAEDNVLFINAKDEAAKFSNYKKRNLFELKYNPDGDFYKSDIKIEGQNSDTFKEFFEDSRFIHRFLKNVETKSDVEKAQNFDNNDFSYKVLNADSLEALNSMTDKTVQAMVTSPPYFNAREYSQWPNLYAYLIDMYNIILKSIDVLKDDGVFLYNIGDINGNEMIVARSNMGNKRMLLGAYSTFLFLTAGYEIVENFIWDKGEPQSKRNTNDGNFTPHYQKPINCYEHMLVFKKHGSTPYINKTGQKEYSKDVLTFSPVIKINSKGENVLGHTAPFPQDIPRLVGSLFTKQRDIILDPFSGSGTSIIAAVKQKRRGVGIELNRQYATLSLAEIKKGIKK